jgi:hypothetical protein
LFLSSSIAKLTELSSFESKLIASFQEKCVSLLLYPLIFQTSTNSLALLKTSSIVTSSPKAKKVYVLSAISK